MNKEVTERVEGREEGGGMDLEKLCYCWREGMDWRKRREKRMGLTPQITHSSFPHRGL